MTLLDYPKRWPVRILYPLQGDSEGRKKFRLNKYNAVYKNIENKTAQMLRVYNAENNKGEKRCGYFDATVTNGGPQAFQPVRYYFLYFLVSCTIWVTTGLDTKSVC